MAATSQIKTVHVPMDIGMTAVAISYLLYDISEPPPEEFDFHTIKVWPDVDGTYTKFPAKVYSHGTQLFHGFLPAGETNNDEKPYSGFKKLLGNDTINSEPGQESNYTQFLRYVIHHTLDTAISTRWPGATVKDPGLKVYIYITAPLSWKQDARARLQKLLRAATHRICYQEVVVKLYSNEAFVSTSLLREKDVNCIVMDVGGLTFDVGFVEKYATPDSEMFRNAALPSQPLGTVLIDEELENVFLRSATHGHGNLSNHEIQEIVDSTAWRSTQKDYCKTGPRNPDTLLIVPSVSYRGELSEDTMTEIFRKYFIGLGIVLNKIWGALEKHPGVVVDRIILTGGGSEIKMIQAEIKNHFLGVPGSIFRNAEIILAPEPRLSVLKGLEKWVSEELLMEHKKLWNLSGTLELAYTPLTLGSDIMNRQWRGRTCPSSLVVPEVGYQCIGSTIKSYSGGDIKQKMFQIRSKQKDAAGNHQVEFVFKVIPPKQLTEQDAEWIVNVYLSSHGTLDVKLSPTSTFDSVRAESSPVSFDDETWALVKRMATKNLPEAALLPPEAGPAS